MSTGHFYISTACGHGKHAECRLSCKFCATPCRCDCHGDPHAKDLTVEEHRELHQELHRALDVLLADYFGHDGHLTEPILNLMRWSHAQELDPSPLPGHAHVKPHD